MGLSNRYKKRVLIFLIIPVLASIPFFTESLVLRGIAAALVIIYVGFIIFLRDSKNEAFKKEFDYPKDDLVDDHEDDYSSYIGEDPDSSFEIVSKNKNPEVLTADTISDVPAIKRQGNFKPPDLKENYDRIAMDPMPEQSGHDEQFTFALDKILGVIKDAYMAHSVVFFWYNKKKNKLTLERYVSVSDEIEEKKYEVEDDILSKIVQKEEPEILSDINPNAEQDNIRYYRNPQGIRSFVGVPLYYGKHLTAVLTLDSKETDAFGFETIYSLAKVVRTISIMISLFESKFAESQAQNRLDSILSILAGEKKFESKSELVNTIEKAVDGLIPWDAFTFVYFDPEEQKFVTSKVINKTKLKYIGENLEVEISGTLTGKAIVSGLPVKIDDISAGEYTRFSKSEDISVDGTYLAIPLVYEDQNYGVLCFESLKKNDYTNADVNFIKNSLKFISFVLYTYSSQALLRNLLSHDVETRALNAASFASYVYSDMLKAVEVNAGGAFALLRIDDFLDEDSLFEESAFPKVLKTVSQMIETEIPPLSTFGRLSEKTFGVYFFNYTTKDAFLWAEKLRIAIARKSISVVSKQTSFTISGGVCSTTGKNDFEAVLNDAGLALDKALEKKGNTIKSLN